MGRRDDYFLDDERADLALRRLLARADEPTLIEPPPDLVSRTLRRLPAERPALAELSVARRARRRLALQLAAIVVVALVAAMSLWSVLGGPQLAGLFGDGGSGLSRVLLTLQLLAKPLLGTVQALGAPLLFSSGVAVLGAVWLWWWLLRCTPTYAYAENPNEAV